MRNNRLKKQTKIRLNYYFENLNSEFCLSQDFTSNSEDLNEVLEELNSSYKKIEKFVDKTIYSTIVSKEIWIESFFDNSKLEKFYDRFHEQLNKEFEGYIEIECSDEILSNLKETQREKYEFERMQNKKFSDLMSTLNIFN
jgi:hypothetical protein